MKKNSKNNQNNFIPEILSPAGSMESLIAAVRTGADAVYLGSGDFNARRNAENFSLNQNDENSLACAVDYCHIRACKVYLTLNTMVREDELEGAFHLAKTAYQLGVDGVIVQDIGFANIVKTHLPNLLLHASTQLACHNASGVKSLIDLGFKRVVLAREMTCNEIENCIGLGAEIEVFVHGALCMSVSGQCLMSSALGERSGNRGLCAQPCRLPFSANGDSKSDYDLSLKDLTLIDYVPKLCEIGVNSFKIEGRMKRPEYVAAATSAFVSARNNFYNISLNKTSFAPTKTDLEDVFSRSGFTAGYFENSVDKNMFGHRRYDDVISAKPAQSKLSKLFKNELKRIDVNAHLVLKHDEPSQLTAVDCDENFVEITGIVPEKAINHSIDSQRAIEQLSKSGNTPFNVIASCEIDDGVTMPIAALNSLRRDALRELEKLRSKKGKPLMADVIRQPDFSFQKAKLNRSKRQIISQFSPIFIKLNGSKVPEIIDKSPADIFILPFDTEHEIIETSVECLRGDKKIGIEIPRGEFYKSDKSTEIFKALKKLGVSCLLVGNVMDFDTIRLAKSLGFEIITNFSLNVANSFSAEKLSQIGADYITLSSELSFAQLENIPPSDNFDIGIFAYGQQPLMMLRNCPIKAHGGNNSCASCFYLNDNEDEIPYLTDRKNIDFKINCYKKHGFVELINSRPLYLADETSLHNCSNLNFLFLYFTDELPSEAIELIDVYANPNRKKSPMPVDKLFTRGSYRKGVI